MKKYTGYTIAKFCTLPYGPFGTVKRKTESDKKG